MKERPAQVEIITPAFDAPHARSHSLRHLSDPAKRAPYLMFGVSVRAIWRQRRAARTMGRVNLSGLEL